MIDKVINQLIAFFTGFSLLALLLMLVYQMLIIMSRPMKADLLDENVTIRESRGTLPIVPVNYFKDENGNWVEFNESSKG